MDVLQALKFVQGGVSTKDLVPEMKHFAIENGEVRSFNGVLALASPIDLDLEIKPLASAMVAAINRCEGVTSLSVTDAGRLRIQSGPFKAFIPCVDGEVPHLKPDGEVVSFNGPAMMEAIAKISRFVGDDASRPWTNGILLRDQSAFATNNVCLVEYWLGVQIPHTVNIPMVAIKEMARIKIPPSHAQLTESSITFHYPDGRWLRTQLFSTDWPDLRRILDGEFQFGVVPEALFTAIEKVLPFAETDGAVFFRDGAMHTSDDENLGASYDVPGLPEKGKYHIKMLALLNGVAKEIDFNRYPLPIPFRGDKLRGAIMGLGA